MMNIVQVQEHLKDFSQDQLVNEMQRPSGNAPQYLVLSELQRRKRMEGEMMANQAQQDQGTVAQDVVSAAGVPQGGIADVARSMAPQTDMTNNTGIGGMPQAQAAQKMASGGVIKAAEGALFDPASGLRYDEMTDQQLLIKANFGDDNAAAELERRQPQVMDELDTSGRFDNAIDVSDPPRPANYGDMRGAPMGMAGLSDAQLALANLQRGADMTAFNPVEPSKAYENPVAQRMAANAARIAEIDKLMAERGTGVYEPVISTPDTNVPQGYAEWAESLARENAGVVDDNDAINAYVDWLVSPKSESGLIDLSDLLDGADVTAARDKAVRDRTEDVDAFGDLPTGEQNVVPESTGEQNVVPESTGDGGAPTGGGIAGVGGVSTPTDLEKSLEQDKWMALAKFGFALMASDSPTLGGAFGEAGQAALTDYQVAKDAFEKSRMDRELLDLEKAKLRASIAASRTTSAPSIPIGAVTMYDEQIAAAQRRLGIADTPDARTKAQKELDDLITKRQAAEIQYWARINPEYAAQLVMQTGTPPGEGASIDVADESEFSVWRPSTW